MRRSDIHKLLEFMGLEKIADRDRWVSSECPFAYWTHDEKVSSRNSFGISVGNPSHFHCFSCGKSQVLTYLPTMLYHYTGKDWAKLREFIYLHESSAIATGVEPYGETKDLPKHVSAKWLKDMFSDLATYRGLTPDTIKAWHLRLDKEENRVIIPVRDKFGRIIAIKGRSINSWDGLKYKLYTELNPHDPKKYGVWFGMHIPLIPNKGLILVEGEIDCMLLKQTGLVSNVWAVMGCGITKEQIATLSAVNHPIIFFFDDDKAGHSLKDMLHKKLKGLTPHYHIKNYFGCKDAGQAVETDRIKAVLATLKKME